MGLEGGSSNARRILALVILPGIQKAGAGGVSSPVKVSGYGRMQGDERI